MKLEFPGGTIREFLYSHSSVRWVLLFGVTLVFIVLLYPSLVAPVYQYTVGDVAEKDIKARKDFLIEDIDATETNRRKVADEILSVYDLDAALTKSLTDNTHKAFEMMRKIIESEKSAELMSNSGLVAEIVGIPVKKPSLHERILEQKTRFEEILGFSVSDGSYAILEKEAFRQTVEDMIIRILTTILDNGVIASKDILLRESDKGIILRNLENGGENIIIRLKSFYGLDQAKTMVRVVGAPILTDFNHQVRNVIVEMVQQLIQPNIAYNRKETEDRKKKVHDSAKPVLYKIKAGEMLLREGERITAAHLLKLNALQDREKKYFAVSNVVGAAMIMLCLLSISYILQNYLNSPIHHDLNKNLIFISSILVLFFLLARISFVFADGISQNFPYGITASAILFSIPIPAGAMTICLFMGIHVAMISGVILSTATAILIGNRFDVMIYFMLNSLVAAWCIQRCRERRVFIRAGLIIGLLNMGLATAICFYEARLSAPDLVWAWAFAFIGGVGTGIVAAGIAPLFELAFDYTTDIKLLELANLDRPILRQLMIEAPGTYHHSVIVGSMVEAAASEIGANSILAKVCGYYHDIGKIRKPGYFIENQTNGKNRHDKLAPSMSKRILAAHVKDGAEIAREHKLGKAIIDTILQHHGTSLMAYFYDKARQLKSDQEVNMDDYRYPGPKPQTREAGLVMLADVVEAASRTLDNPTPARIQGLVQNLINKIFSDGQLSNCELTLKDLNSIAKTYIKILNGIHHHRIEYPEKLVLVGGKTKDGRSDKQPPKTEKDSSKDNPPKSPGHLRRLGLS
ncbi:MAG: HD family phosphohydrolase [Desulfatirhabdiaceae bacterium]